MTPDHARLIIPVAVGLICDCFYEISRHYGSRSPLFACFAEGAIVPEGRGLLEKAIHLYHDLQFGRHIAEIFGPTIDFLDVFKDNNYNYGLQVGYPLLCFSSELSTCIKLKLSGHIEFQDKFDALRSSIEELRLQHDPTYFSGVPVTLEMAISRVYDIMHIKTSQLVTFCNSLRNESDRLIERATLDLRGNLKSLFAEAFAGNPGKLLELITRPGGIVAILPQQAISNLRRGADPMEVLSAFLQGLRDTISQEIEDYLSVGGKSTRRLDFSLRGLVIAVEPFEFLLTGWEALISEFPNLGFSLVPRAWSLLSDAISHRTFETSDWSPQLLIAEQACDELSLGLGRPETTSFFLLKTKVREGEESLDRLGRELPDPRLNPALTAIPEQNREPVARELVTFQLGIMSNYRDFCGMILGDANPHGNYWREIKQVKRRTDEDWKLLHKMTELSYSFWNLVSGVLPPESIPKPVRYRW
jgi:hypothetical protein